MLEHIAPILSELDSPWSVMGLFLIGFFALFWKFGRDLLQVVKETRDTASHVSESIVTNHGSKNLGDAIDRLTSMVMDGALSGAEDRRLIHQMVKRFDAHLEESERLKPLLFQIAEKVGVEHAQH